MENKSAYPVITTTYEHYGNSGVRKYIESNGGLTKLEAFTLAAMQGIMANPNTIFINTEGRDSVIPNIAEDAIAVAKATLKELER